MYKLISLFYLKLTLSNCILFSIKFKYKGKNVNLQINLLKLLFYQSYHPNYF